MRLLRSCASLLALVFAACFAPEGVSTSTTATATTTVPAGSTTTAPDPTNEPTTTPVTTTEPATSTTDTTSSPTTTTTTTGDPTSTTSTSTTSTTTTDTTSTSTTTGTTTNTATSDDSTAATTLEPQCLADKDCPNLGIECTVPACVDGLCTSKIAPPGTLCNGQMDQCDMMGLCVDCVDNGGCGECCYCAGGICIPG